MHYSEFINLGEQEREDVFRSLSDDEVADLWDQKPFPVSGFIKREGRKYFDHIEDLHSHLKDIYQLTKPWMADKIATHERAHAECALALGIVGVKYSVTDTLNPRDGTQVFTHAFGFVELPNIAHAAIFMHPYTASSSRVDMRHIREYGYSSRDHVKNRIQRWNEQDSGLYIPEPQNQPTTYL